MLNAFLRPVLLLALIPFAGCKDPKNLRSAQSIIPVEERTLFPLDEANAADWKVVENGVAGPVVIKDGVMKLGQGDGLTGVGYKGANKIPVVDYELAWEGRLVKGGDFFAAATLPVRKLESCGTFVHGGWGGGITGFSCLDELAANENNTTTNVIYKEGQWYKFRVQVTADMLVAYVDERKVINARITEKKISMRFGDIEQCTPLGFASYSTTGEIRNIALRKLKPGEVAIDPDAY